MTSTKPLTASERYARSVLTAWNKRDLAQLQAALTRSPFPAPAALPAAERERMDLIQDIGRNLLIWDSPEQAENAANQSGALALVRHLARY